MLAKAYLRAIVAATSPQKRTNFLLATSKFIIHKKQFSSFKPPISQTPVFSKTVDAFTIGLKVDGKEERMEIFLRINNPDSAKSQDILEQANKLLASVMPKKSDPTQTTTTTTSTSKFSKFSSFVPYAEKITNVVTTSTSAVTNAVSSVSSSITSNFYTRNRVDELDIDYVWIPKLGILYYKSFEPTVVSEVIPIAEIASEQTNTSGEKNEKKSEQITARKYKEICYEFDPSKTRGSEKLLDPNVPLDEKIATCAGILVGNFSVIPFSQTIAEKLAGKVAQIFLRK